MNKIVSQHVPASEIPARLRQGIDPSSTVTVVVEEEPRRRSSEELKALIAKARESGGNVTTDEAVARIRALRDEWDD